jgi:hypothetical protein
MKNVCSNLFVVSYKIPLELHLFLCCLDDVAHENTSAINGISAELHGQTFKFYVSKYL